MPELEKVPLDWAVRVEDVPAQGLVWQASASAGERQAVADALEILKLAELSVEGRIEGAAGGFYRWRARLRASVVQACVITLEPLPSVLDERFTIEFRPSDAFAEELKQTPDLDAEFDVEPIVNGRLEVGRVVYEHVAAALDPYPRAAGAGLPEVTTTADKAADANPFAVLAKLKPKS